MEIFDKQATLYQDPNFYRLVFFSPHIDKLYFRAIAANEMYQKIVFLARKWTVQLET